MCILQTDDLSDVGGGAVMGSFEIRGLTFPDGLENLLDEDGCRRPCGESGLRKISCVT